MFILFLEIVAFAFLISVISSLFVGRAMKVGWEKTTPRPDIRRMFRDD